MPHAEKRSIFSFKLFFKGNIGIYLNMKQTDSTFFMNDKTVILRGLNFS